MPAPACTSGRSRTRARCKVDLEASQLDVQDLVKLSGQQVPVTGTLAANVKDAWH